MSTFEADLLAGVAARLMAAGVGTFRSNGSSYLSSERAIVIGDLPKQPDEALSLMTYSVTDDPSLSDSVVGVQVTFRSAGQDWRAVSSFSGEAFDALHGLTNVTVGGVRVLQCLMQSATSAGQDESQRWRLFQNYYLTVHRPSSHRQ